MALVLVLVLALGRRNRYAVSAGFSRLGSAAAAAAEYAAGPNKAGLWRGTVRLQAQQRDKNRPQ